MSNQGLVKKFYIERTDGEELPEGAKYFTLRYDSESKDGEASRKALTVYADEIKSINPVLSKELLRAIRYESP
jgi:predicted SnoaL-like aldol condensation-catalyzing enzyme